jgi:hypothetical protein
MELPLCGVSRGNDRHSGIALDELAQHEEARTSDPNLQQIARANAGQAAAPVSLASFDEGALDIGALPMAHEATRSSQGELSCRKLDAKFVSALLVSMLSSW